MKISQWVTDISSRINTRTNTIPPLPTAIWTNPLYFVAFGFGAGAVPFAPGTFGTLLAIPFYLLIRPLPLIYYLILIIAIFIFASWVSEKVSKEIGIHDHPGMCIDEFVGYFVTMINAPHRIEFVILGFILFRIFDIWKPGPIRYIDKNIHGGVGMILDDVVAGIASMIIIQLIVIIFF